MADPTKAAAQAVTTDAELTLLDQIVEQGKMGKDADSKSKGKDLLKRFVGEVLEGALRGSARVRGLRGTELHRVVAEVGVEHPAQRLRGWCRDVGLGLIRRWIAVRFHGAHFTS